MIMVSAMILMLFLFTVVSGLLAFTRTSLTFAAWQGKRTQALYAAEAGINAVLPVLAQLDKAGDPLPNTPLNAGAYVANPDALGPGVGYQVWVYKADLDTGTDRHVRAVGKSGDLERTVEVRLGRSECNPFRNDFVDDACKIDVTVGFNRPSGTLGTLELINAKNNDDSKKPAITFTAEEAARKNPPLYYVRFENDEVKNSTVIIQGTNQNFDIYIDGSLNLKSSVLTVDTQNTSPNGSSDGTKTTIYVHGDLTLGSGSEIVIKPSSRVEFVVDGNVSVDNQSKLTAEANTTPDPYGYYFPRFSFGGNLTLQNNSAMLQSRPFIFLASTDKYDPLNIYTTNEIVNHATFYLGIYAPTRNVSLENNVSGWGSIVAQSYRLSKKAESQYKYLDILKSVSVGKGKTFGVLPGAWREVRP